MNTAEKAGWAESATQSKAEHSCLKVYTEAEPTQLISKD